MNDKLQDRHEVGSMDMIDRDGGLPRERLLYYTDVTCAFCEAVYTKPPARESIRPLNGKLVRIVFGKSIGKCEACKEIDEQMEGHECDN